MRAILSNTKVSLLTASAVSVLSLVVILGTANQTLNIKNVANVGGASCPTQEELIALNESKSILENQISEVKYQIASTTNELIPIQLVIDNKNVDISNIQNKLLSDEVILAEKNKVDLSSDAYLKLASTNGVSSLKLANSKSAYNRSLAVYNALVLNNEKNKSEIISLNADKLDLEAEISAVNGRIADLNSKLGKLSSRVNSINIAIENGVNCKNIDNSTGSSATAGN